MTAGVAWLHLVDHEVLLGVVALHVGPVGLHLVVLLVRVQGLEDLQCMGVKIEGEVGRLSL